MDVSQRYEKCKCGHLGASHTSDGRCLALNTRDSQCLCVGFEAKDPES